ncbi:MAG TPA: hypothetical protein VI911_12215 [Patescibacteria group bacterium]|nr:hypothetical protein [Patescibacteria group bacterium]
MKTDREIIQALLDGKKLNAVGMFGIYVHINDSGYIVTDKGTLTNLDFRNIKYRVYEPEKPKKKHVLYRHYYLDRDGEFSCIYSSQTWEDLNWKGCYKFIETEIIKEIEV